MVDRTVALAKKTGGFGWKALRVSLGSSPLDGAGRVEDTWNLISRAMSKVVHAVNLEEEAVIQGAGLSVLTGDSIKAALDIDWDLSRDAVKGAESFVRGGRRKLTIGAAWVSEIRTTDVRVVNAIYLP